MKTITVIIVPKTRAYNIAALKITEDGYMMYATINNTEGIDIPMILRNVTHPGEITSKKKRAINGTYNISVLIVVPYAFYQKSHILEFEECKKNHATEKQPHHIAAVS